MQKPGGPPDSDICNLSPGSSHHSPSLEWRRYGSSLKGWTPATDCVEQRKPNYQENSKIANLFHILCRTSHVANKLNHLRLQHHSYFCKLYNYSQLRFFPYPFPLKETNNSFFSPDAGLLSQVKMHPKPTL